MNNIFLIIFGIAAFLVVIFIFMRDLILWYFKINERIRLLNDQNEYLKKIHELLVVLYQNNQENDNIDK